VFAALNAQKHRRFIKTHTPLDGIPIDPRVTYIVAGRHPLDMAVSLYHQNANIDHARLYQLLGLFEPDGGWPDRLPLREWLLRWIDNDASPGERLDSIRGVMWHLSGAWKRRHEPNVVLMHYDDLSSDIEGAMRRLASLLGITVATDTWPILAKAASFDQMRARAEVLAPDPMGIFRSRTAFFRQGQSGSGCELLTPAERTHYFERTAQLAPSDLLAWLHRERAFG